MKLYRGFTMLELIAVVVIVGVVSIFAIPNYMKSVNNTKQKIVKNNVEILVSAQKIKKISDGQFQNCESLSSCNTLLNTHIIGNSDTKYFCTHLTSGAPSTFTCNGLITSSQSILSASHVRATCCCGRYWTSPQCTSIPSCGGECNSTTGIIDASFSRW